MERVGRRVTRKRKQLGEHATEKQTAPTEECSSSSSSNSNGRVDKKRKPDGGNSDGNTARTVNKPAKGKAMPMQVRTTEHIRMFAEY